MSNFMHYKCETMSGNIKEMKVALDGDIGTVQIIYKDSDDVHEYANVEIDKIVDLERCYRKLKSKPENGMGHPPTFMEMWSMDKFFSRNIANNDKYKVKNNGNG